MMKMLREVVQMMNLRQHSKFEFAWIADRLESLVGGMGDVYCDSH